MAIIDTDIQQQKGSLSRTPRAHSNIGRHVMQLHTEQSYCTPHFIPADCPLSFPSRLAGPVVFRPVAPQDVRVCIIVTELSYLPIT